MSCPEPADRLGPLCADGDEGLGRADRVGGDGGALDDGVRVQLEECPVREGGRVGTVAVGHDVAARRVDRGCCAPLLAGRETGATAATQTGFFYLFHHLFRGHSF